MLWYKMMHPPELPILRLDGSRHVRSCRSNRPLLFYIWLAGGATLILVQVDLLAFTLKWSFHCKNDLVPIYRIPFWRFPICRIPVCQIWLTSGILIVLDCLKSELLQKQSGREDAIARTEIYILQYFWYYSVIVWV